MQNRGLIFIPDISGFTRFISEGEIDHSRLIIQELLEQLINSNEIGLEISEIEGDAILFYKFGERPDLEQLYKQVEKMFCSFHKNLFSYNVRKYCQCKACTSAIDLTLKVVTHYGEFTNYNVKQFNKLIGKDIIVAHQLLKNDIELHEYWLVTDSLLEKDGKEGIPGWMNWSKSAKITEIGEIEFEYAQLTQLKSEISPDQPPPPEFSDKSKIFSVSRTFDTDIITLFHAVGDFNFRHLWLEGVEKAEEVDHYLPRIGMRCRYKMKTGESILYSSSYSYTDERIEFSETEERTKALTYYVLEKITDNQTELTLDYYVPKSLGSIISRAFSKKRNINERYIKSLVNLGSFLKDFKIIT